jgi:hypothetical protein
LAQYVVLPVQVTAGLSFQATVDDALHPAPAWTCTLHLRGPSQIDLTAAPDGSAHKFTAAPAVTSDWTPGTYWWAIRATDGVDVVEIERGDLIVLPDLTAVNTPYDGRSENEIALEAIDAVLAKRASQDQQRYVINNRELWRTPVADLLKLRSYYNTRVRRERLRAKGLSTLGRNIPVRFS